MHSWDAFTIAEYLDSKYQSGLLDQFHWTQDGFFTRVNLEMRATTIVFHAVIVPELLRFCDEYRLWPETTYYRYDVSIQKWVTPISMDSCVPDDEVIRIRAVLKDN